MQVNTLELLIMLIGATPDLGKSEPESADSWKVVWKSSLPAQAAGRVERHEQDRSWGEGLSQQSTPGLKP